MKPKPKKPLNLILLGDPAAGKATQAVWIVKKYGMRDLDMGRELRKPSVKKRFDFDRSTAKGKLTPTAIVRDILQRGIVNTPPSRGILFDGTPKMAGEAKLVAKWLKESGRSAPLVLYVHIPVAETYRRMAARGRTDDTRAALENRIRYYRTEVARTIAFFKTIYRFKKISGFGSPEEVALRIENEIEKFTK